MAILDVIEYSDSLTNEIVHRIPERGSGEFRLGSQCIVRESQAAVFFRDGKALDVLGPGRHTLSTANIPLLTDLLSIPFGGTSPFRAEVYFVNLREFLDVKWGTVQPVVYRDQEFGMIRIRAFGTYSLRVKDPQLFVNQVVGVTGAYMVSDIEEFLRSIVIAEFNDMLADTMTSILDVQRLTQEIAAACKNALTDDFERLGLELLTFQIMAIAPPEAVQKRIDERSGMAAVGDMNQYVQFQTAQAIGQMGQAGGEGGGGGSMTEGAGLGAGVGMGMAISEAMRQAMLSGQQPAAGQPAPQAAAPTQTCPNCQHQAPIDAKFCPNCGQALGSTTCANCGAAVPAGAKFCPECGTAQTS